MEPEFFIGNGIVKKKIQNGGMATVVPSLTLTLRLNGIGIFSPEAIEKNFKMAGRMAAHSSVPNMTLHLIKGVDVSLSNQAR